MKNIKYVIEKINKMPEFKNMEERIELYKFQQKCLLPTYQERVSFAYIKDKTLFFALKEPSFCVEFRKYKHDEFISLIKEYKEFFPHLQHINKIEAYVPKHIYEDLKARANPPRLQSKELAEGKFENLATDPKIHQLFEAIREAILKAKAQEAKEEDL